MTPSITYMLLYSASLAFIVLHLYSGVLKWVYRPKAYDEHFHELFPAQQAVGVIYLMQVFEIPYLLHIGEPAALLYVNAFALLFFSIQMLVMCELYFFPRNLHPLKDYWIAIPAVIVLVPLFLQALGLIALPEGSRPWVFAAVLGVFAYYFFLNVRMALRIGRTIRQVNEEAYADAGDFPVRFAQYIQWLPVAVCLLLLINFCADNMWVKFARDIVFTVVSIWFCIFTLNPWRKVFTPTEQELLSQQSHAVNRLNDKRYEQLRDKLQALLADETIIAEQHISIERFLSQMNINSKYLTEVIHRSGYQSFYDMINRHRVQMAIRLIQTEPEAKLFLIAERCGFSSAASMTKAFKQMGKESPSAYKPKQ